MNTVRSSVVIDAPAETVVQRGIPQHVIAAFHEAMTRDGRMAAMQVIAGRGYSVKDVAAAASSIYGTEDEIR